MTRQRFKPCSRCGRRLRSLAAAADWNVIVERGVITALICPGCQTAEENTESVINEATMDYFAVGDRIAGRHKGVGR